MRSKSVGQSSIGKIQGKTTRETQVEEILRVLCGGSGDLNCRMEATQLKNAVYLQLMLTSCRIRRPTNCQKSAYCKYLLL